MGVSQKPVESNRRSRDGSYFRRANPCELGRLSQLYSPDRRSWQPKPDDRYSWSAFPCCFRSFYTTQVTPPPETVCPLRTLTGYHVNHNQPPPLAPCYIGLQGRAWYRHL